jgi:hypothetical protein
LDFLFDLSEPLTFFGTALLLLLAAELGFRMGRGEPPALVEHRRSQASAIQTSVLGLLALLLGFTFSMSAARFELHKQLAMDEANAINTAALRASLLPQPYQGELRKLFTPYLQVRLDFLDADPDQTQDLERRSRELQQHMWEQASLAIAADPQGVANLLLAPALTDMFGIAAKRAAAKRGQVPLAVLRLLYFAGGMAFLLIGYGQGLSSLRVLKLVVILAALVAAVMTLIIDFDRPRGGLIQISQQGLEELQQSLGGAAP